ncbi:MAG TPA: NAD-dependent epimerase/dehydratase family protein [Thermoanaerobaculia bacterium]|jgi:nucleoside-diphosphate-sugar epimerase
MPIAFLTGGTGFVGGHVARALVEEGWTVRLLARDTARARAGLLEDLPAEVIEGDLTTASRLASAVAGADAIVHAAGLVKARTLREYREVNARGTERLLAAAGETAPDSLFLLVSSQAAAGPARNGKPVSEGDPARPVSWYGRSKREGEEAVERAWRGPWIVLRPGVIYGPGDRGLFVYFRMAAAGWVPVPAGSTRIQVIGVDQAARAIAKAASRADLAGRTGFLCDPEPVSLRELAEAIARLPARGARLIGVPSGAVRLLGLAQTAVEAITRRSQPFNADKAREILAGDWLCDPAPIRDALGLPPSTPLESGLRSTWDWYRRAGWLPGAVL